MRRGLDRLGLATALTVCALVAAAAPASAEPSEASCDLVVATDGSDQNPGSANAPLRTPAAALQASAPGQTVCFHAGVYSWAGQLSVRTPQTTISSYPGERATLQGLLRVERTASQTTVENLLLDGRNDADLFNPLIYADATVLRNNEITNEHTTNCVHLARYYDAPAPADVVIEDNSIHGCGQLPAVNHEHGIYLAAGTDTIIRNNLIYDNADRGIQLYTRNVTGTRISGNVIAGNGEGLIFASTRDYGAPSGSVVEHNIITDSILRHNVESSYEDATRAGEDNLVSHNCIHGARGWYSEADGSGIQADQVGFSARDNTLADPRFVDAAHGDFSLAPGSPCAGVLDGAGVDPVAGPIVLQSPRAVPVGASAPLSGTVPAGVTGRVTILVRGNRNWHRIGRAPLTGNRFRLRTTVNRTRHFKARALGARDSKAVKVATRHLGHGR